MKKFSKKNNKQKIKNNTILKKSNKKSWWNLSEWILKKKAIERAWNMKNYK